MSTYSSENDLDCPIDDASQSHKVVLFPTPPPTTNALSAAQRTRLVRSSKKIGKILGITPHFVDDGEHSEESQNGLSEDTSLPAYPRLSIDSLPSSVSSRASSYTLTSRSASRASSLCTQTSLPRSAQDTWPGRKPPMLRIAHASPLETIPASPLTPRSPSTPIPAITRHRRSPALDGSPSSLLCTLSPSPTSLSPPPSSSPRSTDNVDTDSPQPSPTAPSFTIPTPTTLRRLKMDRLRRKLGEGVPFRLVFPPQHDDQDEDDNNSNSSPDSASVSDSDSMPSLSVPLSPSSESAESSSEESLTTPGASPVSSTASLAPLSPERDREESGQEHNGAEKKRISGQEKEDEEQVRLRTTSPRRKKIANARDSMILFTSPAPQPTYTPAALIPSLPSPSSPSKRKNMTIVLPASMIPVASRPAPPPPPGSPVKSKSKSQPASKLKPKKGVLKKTHVEKQEITRTNLSPPQTSPKSREQKVRISQLPPVIMDDYRPFSSSPSYQVCSSYDPFNSPGTLPNPRSRSSRSRSGSSSSSSSCSSASGPLDVIPEESPFEHRPQHRSVTTLKVKRRASHASEWFDDEDGDFDFVNDDDVLEATLFSWGSGWEKESASVYGRQGYESGLMCGFGAGRGLARSYGRASA